MQCDGGERQIENREAERRDNENPTGIVVNGLQALAYRLVLELSGRLMEVVEQ